MNRALAIALAITVVFLVVEVIGGLVTDSLALLADAGHMLTDVAALALALVASWLAQKPATPEKSFGYLRAEILAAAFNAAALIVVSLYIFWEAIQRLQDPPEIQSGLMLAVAVAGLAANGASAWVLTRGGGHQHSLNTRGALLHVIGDMLGSVGAILAALIMIATGWYKADPILSAFIGALILWNAYRLLREAVDVLMESTPANVDTAALRQAMEATPGVAGVHDLHVWTVTSGLDAMSSHVEVEPDCHWEELLVSLTIAARDEFGIAHVTLQPEATIDTDKAFHGCTLDTPVGRRACLTHPVNGTDLVVKS
jgi:cobalt-zinc-cadmium efflux system protein